MHYCQNTAICYSSSTYLLGVVKSAENKHIMKKDIHPENYRMVIFHDNSSNERVLIGSTIETTETDTWTDGKEYPITKVDVSSASHPFYTGQEKIMDTAGRVDRFKQRMSKVGKKKA